MDFAIIFLLVEGAYILATAGFGLALTKRGRPYKILLPTVHVFLALFVVAGMLSELLVGMPTYKVSAQVALSVSGLALLGIVGIGITMLVKKTRNMKLADTHKWLVIVFSVTLVVAQGLILFKV